MLLTGSAKDQAKQGELYDEEKHGDYQEWLREKNRKKREAGSVEENKMIYKMGSIANIAQD